MYRYIVSEITRTQDGELVWIEADPAGHLTRRCFGCGAHEHTNGVTAALVALTDHAKTCGQPSDQRRHVDVLDQLHDQVAEIVAWTEDQFSAEDVDRQVIAERLSAALVDIETTLHDHLTP